MTMEIIDFNPHVIQRRLSAEDEEATESGSSLALGSCEMLAMDQDGGGTPGSTEAHGGRMVDLEDNPDVSSDPRRGSQSWIVTVTPSQVPVWIPVGAAMGCSLPYTSYRIPIPPDLNMDFCIDVMMGQDTIVFMFDNEAGDEYKWSILSF